MSYVLQKREEKQKIRALLLCLPVASSWVALDRTELGAIYIIAYSHYVSQKNNLSYMITP